MLRPEDPSECLRKLHSWTNLVKPLPRKMSSAFDLFPHRAIRCLTGICVKMSYFRVTSARPDGCQTCMLSLGYIRPFSDRALLQAYRRTVWGSDASDIVDGILRNMPVGLYCLGEDPREQYMDYFECLQYI